MNPHEQEAERLNEYKKRTSSILDSLAKELERDNDKLRAELERVKGELVKAKDYSKDKEMAFDDYLGWMHKDSLDEVNQLRSQLAALMDVESPTWPYVLAFAKRMEAKLAKNRHKGDRAGWLKDHPWNLVERILDETVEVQQCFTDSGNGPQIDDAEALANECADVANFCMMVADCALTALREKGVTLE